MTPSIEDKERIDIEDWRNHPHESPESDSVHNVINKVTDMPTLLESQRPFDAIFREATDVLELGGGQGWASCLLKRLYPGARYTVTDISPYAVASVHKWERILDVKIDRTAACRSYEIPAEDATYDCVFTYASAHHFMAHRKTLRELRRVLKPGGHAFYFHEPACRRWIYGPAYRRVNRLRPEVPEDVLVFPKILALAREAGLEAEFHFTPSLGKRGPTEFLYYLLLNRIPWLQQLLPCTGTFHFTRK
ncbi:MAG: class SAM-dependent methyltransferase [Fibrobacteria bacterium]|jgi:SAM-dependent methyltransferase|nr:class SAM-dependent methyltransferase [Fibrobacteria bacterium]